MVRGSLLLLEAPCWGWGLHVAPTTLLRTFTAGQELPSFWVRDFWGSNLTRTDFATVTAEGHSRALGLPSPSPGSRPSPTKALAPALQDAGPPFPSCFVPPGFQLHAKQRPCCSRSPGRANKGPQLFCWAVANSPPHSAGQHRGAGSLEAPAQHDYDRRVWHCRVTPCIHAGGPAELGRESRTRSSFERCADPPPGMA